MSNRFQKQEDELNELIARGEILIAKMMYDLGLVEKTDKLKDIVSSIDFNTEYDSWYTQSLYVINQLINERLDDLISQYKQPKRKEITVDNYTMSDYMSGLTVSRGSNLIVDTKHAYPKMNKQVSILKSATSKFWSTLFDIQEIIQADLFDSELQSAIELNKKGFYRASGVIVGVIIEKHLRHICENHNLKINKKNPSISDYNQLLKDADIIDIPQWRFIQHLADIRNLCDHHKDREPTKDDIDGLIQGVDKVIKTVF